MSSSKVSRRLVLKGLGTSLVSLPLLHSARASAADAFPKRLVIVYVPDGTMANAWKPSGGETTFTFGRILKPLEPYKSKLLVMDGIRNAVAASGGSGDGHQRAMGSMLTGVKTVGSGTVWGGGISVDQFIAGKVGTTTRFKSLEFGVRNQGASVWNRMSYSGPSAPVPPQQDPYAAFTRLFSTLPPSGGTPTVDPLLEKRRSVLDHVTAELKALSTQLDAVDREKLDAHLTGVRSLESRLVTPPPPTSTACKQPVMGTKLDPTAIDNYPAISKLQLDLLSMALTCDLTRVASLQFSASVSRLPFTWLGLSTEHHALTHTSPTDAARNEALTNIYTWYMQQLAYLLGKLAAVPEGSGTLLDNTAVLIVSEFGDGRLHNSNPVPYVIAGSCGGYFRTGRNLTLTGVPHNDLLTSLCHAMGAPVAKFGDETICRGPISALT